MGINLEQLLQINKNNRKNLRCQKCKKILNYDFKTKKLYCDCEIARDKSNSKGRKFKNTSIPIFLKNCYCPKHNKFHQYYYKYSKKGLCQTCLTEKKKKNYFIENFSEDYINDLIKKKKEEYNKENKLITTLCEKFNECIKCLQAKFDKYIAQKIKIHSLKSYLINSLQIIRNNYTIISNVKSLKFDNGKNFKFNENDSIENKLKNIYNYFSYESYIDNIYFGKNNKANDVIDLNGPYSLINDENKTKMTDIGIIKNKELIIISFNDGKARIYDTDELGNNNYPQCIVNEFNPNQGINSLYINRNEDSIWKTNDTNKNEIIYLSGYEEVKIIQMNNDYKSYEKLYIIKDENNNIFYSIELDYNKILLLTTVNYLQLVSISKGTNLKDKKEKRNHLLVDQNKSLLSLRKITKNVICLKFINKENEFPNVNNNERIEFSNNINQIEKDNQIIDTINTDNLDDLLDVFAKKENNERKEPFLVKNKEIYTKLISINLESNENIKNVLNNEDDCNLDIKNEYILPKNYQFLGNISEEDNLFLFNYNNLFYIFDFNICQFTYIFNSHNKNTFPKYFVKYNYDFINDKEGFVIINEDFSLTQYFYDNLYTNKIYYINKLAIEQKINNSPNKMFSAKNKFIVFCNNNDYYMLCIK